MSAFTGAVVLAGEGSPKQLAVPPPPDERGLERGRSLGSAISTVIHRQRVVFAEDRTERQPMPAWGGAGWLAFCGRLDDRAALAASLGADPAALPADGELARLAIERWGAEAPRRLLGDYALAAWRDDRRELILAADPMAMRTVYYWRDADRVVFSTSLRGLVSVPGVPRLLNEPFIADFLALNFGEDEETFYRGIRKIGPGTAIILTPGGMRTIDTRRFDPERRLTLKDDAAYLEAAREILDRAVADRLRAATVPISASGGLDSACLAVGALAAGPRPVRLLTAVPDPRLPVVTGRMQYADETRLVRAMTAALPGLDAEFLEPSPDADWNPEALHILAASGVPHRVPGQTAWFDAVHRRAAGLGASSLLTGGCGNLTLTWDGLRSLPNLFLRGAWLTVARELVCGARGHPRRLAGLIHRELVLPLRARSFRPDALAAYCALHPEAMRDLGMLDRLKRRGNDPGFLSANDSRRWRIHVLHRNRSRRPETTNMLRGLYGLDEAMPLGDLRMIEFCLAIPENQFLKHGTMRRLARRLLREAGVPAAVSENRSRGQQHPEWFAHLSQARPTFAAQIERLRRSPMARRLIDVDRLEHLVRDWPADAVAAQRRNLLFQALLPQALSLGAFIAWAEGTN